MSYSRLALTAPDLQADQDPQYRFAVTKELRLTAGSNFGSSTLGAPKAFFFLCYALDATLESVRLQVPLDFAGLDAGRTPKQFSGDMSVDVSLDYVERASFDLDPANDPAFREVIVPKEPTITVDLNVNINRDQPLILKALAGTIATLGAKLWVTAVFRTTSNSVEQWANYDYSEAEKKPPETSNHGGNRSSGEQVAAGVNRPFGRHLRPH